MKDISIISVVIETFFLYSNLSFSLFAFKTVYSYFIYKVRFFYGKKKGGEEIEE